MPGLPISDSGNRSVGRVPRGDFGAGLSHLGLGLSVMSVIGHLADAVVPRNRRNVGETRGTCATPVEGARRPEATALRGTRAGAEVRNLGRTSIIRDSGRRRTGPPGGFRRAGGPARSLWAAHTRSPR